MHTMYEIFFHTAIVLGILPLVIMIIFSVLAFLKIRTISYRQINIVRSNRDLQLVIMTLFHVLYIIIARIQFIISKKNEVEFVRNQLEYAVQFYFQKKDIIKRVIYVLIDILSPSPILCFR